MIGGLLGKKIGMTQVYRENGDMVGVTVIQAGPCQVMQIKTAETDGYAAVQLGMEDRKRKGASKPESGHARKAKAEPKRFLREVGYDGTDALELGQVLTVDILKDVTSVDVIGITKGKGFQGGMKRHGFHGHKKSHGASKDHRKPGSIGANTDPARVWPGVRMAGHMGTDRKTAVNLQVVKIDSNKNLLLVEGAVPGYNGSFVIVRSRPARKEKKS